MQDNLLPPVLTKPEKSETLESARSNRWGGVEARYAEAKGSSEVEELDNGPIF